MPLGNKKIKWDSYEAAILLDGYLEMLHTNIPKMQIVRKISGNLRSMAMNRGFEIDEIFRNENGISYQIQCMESAYKGTKVNAPATKLFKEIVELYNLEPKRYHELLEEAKKMVSNKPTRKEEFLHWIESTSASKRCKWVEENLLKIEEFAIAIKIIDKSIYDITDKDLLNKIDKSIKRNKVFQVKYKKIIHNIITDFEIYRQFCFEKISQSNQLMDIESKESEGRVENVVAFNNTIEDYQEENINENGCPYDIPKGEELVAPIIDDTSVIEDEDSVAAITSDVSIVEVLNKHFKYGFKYDSIREMMRFRQFADEMGINLPEDDAILRKSILLLGTVIDGKVYCKRSDMKQELQNIVDSVFATAANVIYYEKLFERYYDWMENHVVTSPEMLKEYLQRYIKDCAFSKKFMVKGIRRSEKDAVTEEIKRVWSDRAVESVYTLEDRLPYIPLNNIWRVISGNDLFVLVAEGEYLFIDRFIVCDDDIEDIIDYTEVNCRTKGFASISDVPLGDIEENNYELPILTIYNAIYKKILANKYHLNGKILTKGKSDLDAVYLLKEFIKGKDACTFDEVSEEVINLTGAVNRQYAFQALYDDMVRVEKNYFVAERFVDFSVDDIDNVLSSFITDKIIAIKDITTFAMFPLCGQNWNHYLLESFCYKYSKKFCLHVIHFNDRNAGIISEKDMSYSFDELLSFVTARANIDLTPEKVGQYLFDSGYLSKSKYAKLDDIIQNAKKLRTER